MYSDVDYCRHKTVLKRSIGSIFFTLILLGFMTNTYANLPGNPRDDTPAQSLKRMQNHFKNQESYNTRTQRNAAEQIANVKMGSPGSAERNTVEQMLRRSGVLDSGAKATLTTKVTQPVNNAKVASTLVDRLKKAKDYAKHVGKASIPSFVGMAVFHGLMEGVGWVMDEGGKVTKRDVHDGSNIPNTSIYFSCDIETSTFYYSTERACIDKIVDAYTSLYADASFTYNEHSLDSALNGGSSVQIYVPSWGYSVYKTYLKRVNPNYNPSAPLPESIEVTNAELETALKKALDANNAAQAQLIAEAIKSAYSNDVTEGQDKTSNDLVYLGLEDMSKVQDQVFDNPTSTATADKPSGSYKITDGEKTIEGNVNVADTSGKTSTDSESTTVTDPVTGNQTTTGSSSGSLELPAFCDWANIVCDWIGWTKENPESTDDNEPPEIKEIEIGELDTGTFKATAGCPAPILVPVNLGDGGNVEISYEPLCQFATKWSFVAPLIGFLSGAMIIVGVGRKGEDGEI